MPKPHQNQPTREQLLEYTQALEGVNKQLVIALKRCLELLATLPEEISGSKEWQEMYKKMKQIAEVGERISGIEEEKHESDKTLH